MQFQILSDLHLEVGQQYSTFQIPVEAGSLILAGDIGRLQDYQPYLQFLHVQCQNFQHVFLILGNHEFYGITRAEGLQLAAKLSEESVMHGRLVVLGRNRFDFSGENISLLGCTLHSHISQESRGIVRSKVNDFSRILDWTVEDHNASHEKDLRWLQDEISSIRSQERNDGKGSGIKRKKIVVVTHHAPIKKSSSRPEHENNPWSDAFATELLGPDTTEVPNLLLGVDWFVFGHTHFTTSCTRGSVKLISNQRGYVLPGQQQCPIDCAKGSGSNQRNNKPRVTAERTKQRSLSLARLLRRGNKHTTPEPGYQEFDVARCIDV